MLFGGLQKVSLLDFPGLVACTVFTNGCNFRCPFCHNARLVLGSGGEEIPEEKILDFLKKRQGILEGITVTGGEPLLHPSLRDFLLRVKELGYSVKLDTNGSRPDALQDLVEQGLVDRVAMDIKNAPDAYAVTVGLPGFDLTPVTESKDYLLADPVDYEFRTTVVRGLHTRETLQQAAMWIAGGKKYFLQGFVDHGDLVSSQGLGAFSRDEMESFLHCVREYVPNAELRGI